MRKNTKILCSFRLTDKAIEHLEAEADRIQQNLGIKINRSQVLEAIIAEHIERKRSIK